MNTPKEYKIISTAGAENLQSMVNDAIREGWTPLGGVCVVPVPATEPEGTAILSFAFQAVVR